MAADPPQFAGTEDPPIDGREVHRWYLFTRSDGATARVGITRTAAAARRAAGDDEEAIDTWAIDVGGRVLADHQGDDATEVVLDLPPNPDLGT